MSLYAPLPDYAADAGAKPPPDDFAQRLVRAVAPGRAFEERVQGKQVVLENRRTTAEAREERRKRKAERRKSARGRMPAKERRAAAVWDVLSKDQQYDAFLPLHELWNSYIGELVGTRVDANAPAKLMKADYHGAILTVVKATAPSLVGLSGIVIKETENTFQIVTRHNRLKVVPKANAVFRCTLPMPPHEAVLYGNQLQSRPAERSSRKAKYAKKGTVDL
ncbi:RNase P/MRP, p29 subunit [Hyaloraphidium curvatum]|nr:RNase P/MRP, p29 subunit [Hyaloraphidium curvatum]